MRARCCTMRLYALFLVRGNEVAATPRPNIFVCVMREPRLGITIGRAHEDVDDFNSISVDKSSYLYKRASDCYTRTNKWDTKKAQTDSTSPTRCNLKKFNDLGQSCMTDFFSSRCVYENCIKNEFRNLSLSSHLVPEKGLSRSKLSIMDYFYEWNM